MNAEHGKHYDQLRKLIEASPNREIPVWLINVEDIYETAFGDGKYVYGEKMFLSYKVASSWARWIGARTAESELFTGYIATIASRVLRLGPDGIITVSIPGENAEDEEVAFKPYDLLDDNPSGWNSIIEWCCRKGKTRPDWNHKWE